MASLELVDVAVEHDGRPILDPIDLAVPDGERVALLGGSGAGKSTLLRAIAGAHPISRGTILLDGQDISELSEADRDISLLTQSARLLPHRRVAGNLGFPLELRSVPRADIDEQVRAQARTFSLDELLDRRTSTLSAGEAAEVALARSLIRRSQLLLLDEPFARLGPAERATTIRDVIRLQEGAGSTLLLATNDWRVAATIAPTIAVLSDGRIVQVGDATSLVTHPATLQVAWLVVDGPLNLLPGLLTRRSGRTELRCEALQLATWELALTERSDGPVQVAIPANGLDLATSDERSEGVSARVTHHAFLGDHVDVTVTTEDAQLIARCTRPVPPVGATVTAHVDPRLVHVFDALGDAIAHGV